MELKAEKLTKTLAANYSLVKSVTDNFTKLGTDNYDPWRRRWDREIPSLSYNKDYLSIEGPELDLKAEKAHETTQRKNAAIAMMFLKTIDHSVHEEWLRDVDHQNPQAIIRRIHLRFRGSNTVAISSVIEAQLLLMTMKSTRLNVTAYGSAIIEGLRKLREMNAPMCEVKMITLYLLGLNEVFDTIRFTIEALIAGNKPTAPKTMAQAKKMVEDWAVKFKDRGLLTFKDTSGGVPTSTVLTLLGEVNKVSSPTSPDANANADADARRDFSSLKCTECNVTGHSSLWGGCPTRLAKAAAAKNILHLSAPSPAPAASSGSPSQAPTIHPLSDSMTVKERALHEHNEKLLHEHLECSSFKYSQC